MGQVFEESAPQQPPGLLLDPGQVLGWEQVHDDLGTRGTEREALCARLGANGRFM